MPRTNRPPSNGGVWAATDDGRFSYRMGAFLHLESDTYLTLDGEDEERGNETSFYLRRARATAEATMFGILDARLLFDLSMDVIPLDAYLDLRAHHAANVRFGKFKSPFGFERLAPIFAVQFIERAYPTDLGPNRDFGVFLHGQTLRRTFGYEAAVLGGAEDLEINHFYGGSPHFAGRVYAMPFQASDLAPLADLGVGASTTVGESDSYDGLKLRWSVHAHYAYERLGAWFEYVETSEGLGSEGGAATNRAWVIQSSVMLTDDQNRYFGLKPSRPYSPGNGQLGAMALALRIHELRLGADPSLAHDQSRPQLTARAGGAAFLWKLNHFFEGRFDVEYAKRRPFDVPTNEMVYELAIRARIEARF